MAGLVIVPTLRGSRVIRPERLGASSMIHSVRTLRVPFSMATCVLVDCARISKSRRNGVRSGRAPPACVSASMTRCTVSSSWIGLRSRRASRVCAQASPRVAPRRPPPPRTRVSAGSRAPDPVLARSEGACRVEAARACVRSVEQCGTRGTPDPETGRGPLQGLDRGAPIRARRSNVHRSVPPLSSRGRRARATRRTSVDSSIAISVSGAPAR